MRSVACLLALLFCLIEPISTLAADDAGGGDEVELGLPLDDTNLSDLTETRVRPLFAPSRRQPLPPAAPVSRPVTVRRADPPDTPQLPSIHLLGVIAIRGERTALIAAPGVGTVRLKTGDDYQGWTVMIPDSKTIGFHMGGRSQTFRLFEPK